MYVITSNFEKIRFYINNAVDFEEFDLFHLNLERFKLLYLCLSKDNILENKPLKIKEASVQEEAAITKKFYADYSLFKRELFRNLVKLNMKNDVFRTELNHGDSERGTRCRLTQALSGFRVYTMSDQTSLLPYTRTTPWIWTLST